METRKATKAKAVTKANPKRKRREPRAWYIADGVRIPLDEFMKDEPKYTGPLRMDVLRKEHPEYFGGKILDMRAVLK
jgi:hypothetical protein